MGNPFTPSNHQRRSNEDDTSQRIDLGAVYYVMARAMQLQPTQRFLTNATALARTIVDAVERIAFTSMYDIHHCLQLAGRFHLHMQAEGLLDTPWLQHLESYLHDEDAVYQYEMIQVLLRRVNQRARQLEGGGLHPDGYAWLFRVMARFFDTLWET